MGAGPLAIVGGRVIPIEGDPFHDGVILVEAARSYARSALTIYERLQHPRLEETRALARRLDEGAAQATTP